MRRTRTCAGIKSCSSDEGDRGGGRGPVSHGLRVPFSRVHEALLHFHNLVQALKIHQRHNHSEMILVDCGLSLKY